MIYKERGIIYTMTPSDLLWPEPEEAMGELIRPKATGLYETDTVNLRIGDVCCAFRCSDEEVVARLRQRYDAFITEQPPDITIELESTDRISPEDLGRVMTGTKYLHDKKNGFQTTSKIMSGEYNLDRHFIKITGEKSLVNPDLENNHLNKLLAMSYYSACKVKYGDVPPAMLVHAAGILRHGQVWIFTGPSESGKTTVATLCREQDGEVINDEMMLVYHPGPEGNHVGVRSAPILGKFVPQRQVTAPLRAIFMLKKSHQTLVTPLGRTEAYLKLMRQIITPAYIGQSSKREVLSLIADFSVEITGVIPVYELEFTLDGESLWQVVGEIEGMTSIKES
jgi:hypothetical protein